MVLKETSLAGVIELQPSVHHDNRGYFVKTFHRTTFAENNLHCDFPEEYHSRSSKDVIRGLHFQTPPEDHIKIVYCAEGAVFDVVVDLRRNSPTFGKHACATLTAELSNMLYIPSGFAHGFCTISDVSAMCYKTSTEYSAQNDDGIRWDSLDITWPTSTPTISSRDESLQAFGDFSTPFLNKT